MCRDTFGANPVNAFTCAASATFSNASRGVPAVVNTLNRVPEFPYAQDGTSIPKSSRSARAAVVVMGDVLVLVFGGCHNLGLIRFICQAARTPEVAEGADVLVCANRPAAMSRFSEGRRRGRRG